MRILVTGGAGFIGSHLVARLIDDGHRVTVVDNFSTGNKRNLKSWKKEIKIFPADICDCLSLAPKIGAIEAIFHLASKVTVSGSFHKKVDFERINIQGTLEVLKLAMYSQVTKFIFVSSAAVYGNQSRFPICETAPTRPLSPLGKTKLAAEAHCLDFAKRGLDVTILRLFNVYGPGQNPAYESAVTTFIDDMRRDRSVVIDGDGSQTRDFIAIDDVTSSLVASLKKNLKSTIFNIGSGKEISIRELFLLLCDILGRRPVVTHRLSRTGDITRSVACIHQARQYLNFEPKVTLIEGLQKLTAYGA